MSTLFESFFLSNYKYVENYLLEQFQQLECTYYRCRSALLLCRPWKSFPKDQVLFGLKVPARLPLEDQNYPALTRRFQIPYRNKYLIETNTNSLKCQFTNARLNKYFFICSHQYEKFVYDFIKIRPEPHAPHPSHVRKKSSINAK